MYVWTYKYTQRLYAYTCVHAQALLFEYDLLLYLHLVDSEIQIKNSLNIVYSYMFYT